jgi:hypothetical protein
MNIAAIGSTVVKCENSNVVGMYAMKIRQIKNH